MNKVPRRTGTLRGKGKDDGLGNGSEGEATGEGNFTFLRLKAFPPRCVGKSQTYVKLTLIQNSTPNIITYVIYKAGSEGEVKSNFE